MRNKWNLFKHLAQAWTWQGPRAEAAAIVISYCLITCKYQVAHSWHFNSACWGLGMQRWPLVLKELIVEEGKQVSGQSRGAARWLRSQTRGHSEKRRAVAAGGTPWPLPAWGRAPWLLPPGCVMWAGYSLSQGRRLLFWKTEMAISACRVIVMIKALQKVLVQGECAVSAGDGA